MVHRWLRYGGARANTSLWAARQEAMNDIYRHVSVPTSARSNDRIHFKKKLINAYVVMGGINKLVCHRLSETPLRIAPFDVHSIEELNGRSSQAIGDDSTTYFPFSPNENDERAQDTVYKYRSLSKRKVDALADQLRRKIYVDSLSKFKRKLSLLLEEKSNDPNDVAGSVDAFIENDFGIYEQNVRLPNVTHMLNYDIYTHYRIWQKILPLQGRT